MLRTAVLGSIGLCAATLRVGAQDPVFKQLDSRHGLSNNSAFQTLQDHQGFIWIGTNDGLNRYDGHGFLVFRHDPADSASLSNNTVRRLWEDGRHRLWVRTESGVDRLDRRTGRFRRYPVSVAQLIETPGGDVLVAGSDGIFRHDATTDRFEPVTRFPLSTTAASPSDADPVWGFLRDQQGTLWISTQEGRLFGIASSGIVSEIRSASRYTLLLEVDRAGRLLIGHQRGMESFDPRTRTFSRVPETDAIRGRVLSSHRLRDGTLWLGGDELHRLRPGAVQAERVPVDSGHRDPLAIPIWSIREDREGAIWLATPTGLRISDPYAKPFGRYRHDPGNPASLSADPVMALTVDRSGALWAGTVGAGLNRIDPTSGMVQRYGHQSGASTSLCGDRVWALQNGPDGRLWVGTEAGLCALDTGSGNFSSHRLPGGVGGLQPVVFALAHDRHGVLWAGTTMGLFRIEPAKGATTAIGRILEDRPGIVRIEGIAADREGILWVGTSWSDLYRIDPTTRESTYYPLGNVQALRGSEGFWDIEPRPDGRLWLASDRGLFLFDPTGGTLTTLGQSDGVPAGPVFALVTDASGALWLSTGDGLFRYQRPLESPRILGEVRHYAAADGISVPEFNRRAAALAPDGRLLFGGMGGVTHFYPSAVRDNPHPPPVVFSRIERARRSGVVAIPPYRADTVVAAFDDIGLAFEYTALTYSSPLGARYAYQLVGVDPQWISAGTERRARYPALAPGRYTFQVRAANADGVWGGTAASVAIVVPAPWWATWWFRGAAGIIVVGLLALLVRSVATRKLRRRVRALELEQQVQRERNRISRDLHDNVGSQVSTILAGIELIQLSAGDAERVDGYLAALRSDAERTMAELRDTVWSLHHDEVTLGGLLERIEDHLGARRRYLPRPALSLAAQGPLDRVISSAQALHLFRVVQEGVSNAIRHSGASTVAVEMHAEAESVRLTIRDDGVFHPPADGHGGVGIEGMRSRAAEAGGTFALKAGAAGGTVVQVSLPVAEDRA